MQNHIAQVNAAPTYSEVPEEKAVESGRKYLRLLKAAQKRAAKKDAQAFGRSIPNGSVLPPRERPEVTR